MGQLLGDQEALMGAEAAGEGLGQLGQLLAQAPLGQLGQRRGVLRACHQRREHLARRLAGHVGSHRRQLAGGPCQRLVQPLHFPCALADLRRAIAGQFAPFPLLLVGDEAAPQQPVPPPVGQPLALLANQSRVERP